MSETFLAQDTPDGTPAPVSREPRALSRARQDLAGGRPALARERLTGFLYTLHRRGEYREEVYALLGEVHFTMKDPARAGAAWLLTSKTGPEVEEALRAFQARYGQDPVNMLKETKPHAPSELYPPPVQERLRAWGYRYRPYRPRSNPHVLEEFREASKGLRPAEVGCAILALAFAALAALYLMRVFRIL